MVAAMLLGSVKAQSVELTRPEARAVASDAVGSGQTDLARDIALGLIEADPLDRDAWLILAAAEVQGGSPSEGRRAASRAYRLSRSPEDRYEAARIAALAARNEGQPFLAEIWLRLALVAAPTPEDEAQTRSDAAALRRLNPWRIDVGLSFSPSGNVNGGADEAINVIDGLPFVGLISVDGRALSGWEGALDLGATRRLSEGRRHRTTLGFRLRARSVALSDEARDLIETETREGDPRITGSDFSQLTTEVTLSHDRALGRGIVDADLTLASNWYGGDLSRGTARVSLGGSWPVARSQVLRLSGFVEARQDRYDEAWETAGRRDGVSATWRWRAPRVADLTLVLGRVAVTSENGNAASTAWSLRAGVAPRRAFGPARLSVWIGAEEIRYPDYAILLPVPGGRRDERLTASVEAALVGWDFAGFVPIVSLEAERSLSNVSRFEHEGLGLGFALRSTF